MSLQVIHTALSPLDHIPPKNYVKFALYLPLDTGVSPKTAFTAIQEALHRTFVQLPWLSGKVFAQSVNAPGWRPGQLELQHTPVQADGPRTHYQLKFKKLDTEFDYETLKENGFPTDAFEDEDLHWAPFIPNLENGADVFVAQANFVPGACILVAAIFHPVSDGMGLVNVFRIWADNCRNIPTLDIFESAKAFIASPETNDRRIVENLLEKEAAHISTSKVGPAAWKLLGLDPPDEKSTSASNDIPESGKTVSMSSPSRVMKSNIFYIPTKNLATLRKDLARELAKGDEKDTSILSANDALSALLWRGLFKARFPSKSPSGISHSNEVSPTSDAFLEMTLDGRNALSTSLPAAYLGNVVLINQSTMPLFTLASPSTKLSSVAHILHQSSKQITLSSILDALSLIQNIPDYNQLKLRFTSVEGAAMMITSLLMFPTESIRFGDQIFQNEGIPEAVRPLMGAFNKFFRISFVLPRKSHGGVEVVVSLFEDEMDRLLEDEEFSKYAMFFA